MEKRTWPAFILFLLVSGSTVVMATPQSMLKLLSQGLNLATNFANMMATQGDPSGEIKIVNNNDLAGDQLVSIPEAGINSVLVRVGDSAVFTVRPGNYTVLSVNAGDHIKSSSYVSLPDNQICTITYQISPDVQRMLMESQAPGDASWMTMNEMRWEIKNGYNVNARGKDGLTPLMYAVLGSDPEKIIALLKAGADAKAEDNAELRAFDYAKDDERLQGTDAYRMLEQATPPRPAGYISQRDKNQELILDAAREYPEQITEDLEAGADINAHEADGTTALIRAANVNDHPEVIITLLKAGADAKAKDGEGKTALDYAKGNESLQGTDAYRMLEQASQ